MIFAKLISGSEKNVSPYYAALFRMLLGFFFLVQSLQFLSLESGLDPGVLAIVLSIAAVLLILGVFRRTMALILWLGFAWIYARQPLLEPTAGGLTGILLLFQMLLPPGEGLGWKRLKADPEWRFPLALFWGSWLVLGIYYGWNAFLKCQSPSWQHGLAVKEILQSVLVQEGWLRHLLLGLSTGVLQTITFVVWGAEIAFVICWIRKLRPWVWLFMLGVQIFWFFLLNDGVGNLGIILFHLWIFDPSWFPSRKSAGGKSLVLYDGVCGMCNSSVQFLLREDHGRILQFAALQGSTSENILGPTAKSDLTSIVYVRDWQSDRAQKFTHSDAVLQVLNDLGGFWRVVSWSRVVPGFIRDGVYRMIARSRYRVFGKYDACPLPDPGVRERFLP